MISIYHIIGFAFMILILMSAIVFGLLSLIVNEDDYKQYLGVSYKSIRKAGFALMRFYLTFIETK